MVSTDSSVIAKFQKFGKNFELMVDPDLAMKLKHGQTVSFADLLVVDKVFEDSKRGEMASEADVKKVFPGMTFEQIVQKIIAEGEVQLTTQQRQELTKKKHAEVITLIVRNAFDPQTKSPHPPQRIENALEQLKIHIDPFKSAKEQLPEIIEKLRAIIPISIQAIQIQVKIPAQFVGKTQGILHQYTLVKQDWMPNGSLQALVELPGGLKEEFFGKINSVGHGAIELALM